VKAMEKEMPKTSWRNLPEARMIGPLIASAARRTGGMIAEAATDPHKGPGKLAEVVSVFP